MVLLLYFWNLLQRVFFRERERERKRFFEFNGNINNLIWYWYSRWVDWILKFVKGNDLYDRFEFGTFYSLSAFPKA